MQKVASECPKFDGNKEPLLLTAELVNEAQTKTLLEDTIAYFGKLDVLVNSAGNEILYNDTDAVPIYMKINNHV